MKHTCLQVSGVCVDVGGFPAADSCVDASVGRIIEVKKHFYWMSKPRQTR